MAGRNKKPLTVHMGNGNPSHLTREEIAQRESAELHAPADNITAPGYLSQEQKESFTQIARQLCELNIMSNLDCSALARYIQSEERYRIYDEAVSDYLKTNEIDLDYIKVLEKLENLRDKAFKQCRYSAADLGLTIASRCRLVAPQATEAPKNNKFEKFDAG